MPNARSPAFLFATAALLAAGCMGTPPSPSTPDASTAPTPLDPMPTAYAEPPSLSNRAPMAGAVEVDLVARRGRVALLPGKEADVLTYNGSYPGPTLDLVEGDRVLVHFSNDLDEPTNVHWHGLPVPSDQDGQPMDLVAPGARRDYAFTIPEGAAGTYWYHPHPHGRTAAQVRAGLVGAIRVRAKRDPLAAYPETLLVLTDNRFSPDGAIASESHMDRMHGRQSDTFFVNGLLHPTLRLRAGEVRRVRIVNASSARYHQLALPGHTFIQVGTDGGLFEAPVERPTLTLAPAERVEVLLRATGQPGSTSELTSEPIDTGMQMGGGPQALMTIAFDAEQAGKAPPVPRSLRPVPALSEAGAIARTLTLTDDSRKLDFRIDGKLYAPDRVDQRAKLGSTEVWRVENGGEMDHPFHLHGFQFQVLDQPFRAWKDTVNVPRGQAVRLIVRFDRLEGPRVYHCHILEHEDQGMMGTLLVE